MSYARSIEAAKRAIARKGDNCTWRKYTLAAGDKPWTEGGTGYTDYPVRIVFLPFDSRTAHYTVQQVDGDVARITEYALMAPSGFVPDIRDAIIRSDGTVLKPAGIDPLKPGSEVLLYTIGIVG
jgi:hypothetical protein